MDSTQLVILIIVVILILYLWDTRPGKSPPPSSPLLPPPALPPGHSYVPDYKGTDCSFADQYNMQACQNIYKDCIQRSLDGKANFATCHKDFMERCMPIIRRCQTPAEEEV